MARALLLVLLLAAAAHAHPKDVPYVATPLDAVEKMLDLAAVRSDDVVYDLGCGDGRIVIAAARRGARGVGIDLDENLLSECGHHARQAGVTERVRFLKGNLFEADISDATVVTLYLQKKVNLELRPKLLRELKPGTRVVSHDFDMGDWRPTRKVAYDYHTLYLWVIP